MAAQIAPQNSSVQNVHSHALPSSLVPFEPCCQYKVCEQILRGVAGGVSLWCWSACCQSEEGNDREPSVVLFGSFSTLALRWAAERSVRWWTQWSNSERQHSRTRFFRENCVFFPASFKSRRKKKWKEDWRRRDDLAEDQVLTCLRRQLSWTARRWRWWPPSLSLASAAASAPAGRTDPQCRLSPSHSASAHLQHMRKEKD